MGSGLHYFNYGESGHRITECKEGGKYSKGLFIGTKESEDYRRKKLKSSLKSQLLIVVIVHDPLKNIVIADC